jgi:hypothetical protein
MKHLKTPQELNEASENLNISDVMSSFTLDDLKKAFIDGQNSVSAEIGYEQFGDMDAYPKRVINKNFDKWFEENYS